MATPCASCLVLQEYCKATAEAHTSRQELSQELAGPDFTRRQHKWLNKNVLLLTHLTHFILMEEGRDASCNVVMIILDYKADTKYFKVGWDTR